MLSSPSCGSVGAKKAVSKKEEKRTIILSSLRSHAWGAGSTHLKASSCFRLLGVGRHLYHCFFSSSLSFRRQLSR
jgi:hypothetical protein